MDKDRVIQLVKKAFDESSKLYPELYHQSKLRPSVINEAIENWTTFVENHQRSLNSELLNPFTLSAHFRSSLEKYEARILDFINGTTNFFDTTELYDLLAGKLICQELLVWLRNTALVEVNNFDGLSNKELAERLVNKAKEKAKIDFDIWENRYLPEQLKQRNDSESREILRKKRIELSDKYLKNALPGFFNVRSGNEIELLRAWTTEYRDYKDGIKTFIPGGPTHWLTLLAQWYKVSYQIDYLDAMLSDNLETWQKKKYDRIAFYAAIIMKLHSASSHIPERAMLDALEQANADDWPQGRKNLGMRLPIEQQRKLAADLVEIYQKQASPSTDQLEYLKKVVERFFEQHHSTRPSQPAAKDKQESLSFESLFIDQSGEKLCMTLCEGIGIPDKVAREKADSKKNRYKNRFAVVWQILKDKRLVHSDLPDQKACEAIAQRFDASIGKNTWSDWSVSKDSPQSQTIYRETIRHLPK
jgi:hypothetical protein